MDRDRQRQRDAMRAEVLRQQQGAADASNQQREAALADQRRTIDLQRASLLALAQTVQQRAMASAAPATMMPATGRKKRRALFGRKSAHFRRL
uniref:Transcriptional regulator n=1 Tax=Haemonchus contortus TaxID=6289 RepID=A0A7I4YR58_HAECO